MCLMFDVSVTRTGSFQFLMVDNTKRKDRRPHFSIVNTFPSLCVDEYRQMHSRKQCLFPK